MALRITLLDGKLHDRLGFSCGIAALDDYLHQRAGQHQRDGIATTHMLTDDAQPARILGFCAPSAAQLHLSELGALGTANDAGAGACRGRQGCTGRRVL